MMRVRVGWAKVGGVSKRETVVCQSERDEVERQLGDHLKPKPSGACAW
jgi:hypothetical protein